MASVNQTRPHRINQMGKTHSKPLAARHGMGTAWAQHGHGMLCVNRPFWTRETETGQQVTQLHDRYMMMLMTDIRIFDNYLFQVITSLRSNNSKNHILYSKNL